MATNNKKTNGNPRARKMEPAPELNAKLTDLQPNIDDAADAYLTTNQGVRINDNQNSLKAGERGPSLLEDFILREKITHFDHERIPERVVHARGTGAHGFFQAYESQAALTRAQFLQDPKAKDSRLRALFDRGRFARLNRHGARRARLRGEVLY